MNISVSCLLVFLWTSLLTVGITHVLWHPQTGTATDISQLLFWRNGPVSSRKPYKVIEPKGQRWSCRCSLGVLSAIAMTDPSPHPSPCLNNQNGSLHGLIWHHCSSVFHQPILSSNHSYHVSLGSDGPVFYHWPLAFPVCDLEHDLSLSWLASHCILVSVAVLKHWPKPTWEEKSLFWLAAYSS